MIGGHLRSDQLHSLQTSEVPSYATLRFRNQRLVEDSLIEQAPRTHDESWISQLRRLNKVCEEERFPSLPLNPNTLDLLREKPYTGACALEGSRFAELQSQGWQSAADLIAQALDPCRNMEEERPFLRSRTIQFSAQHGSSLLLPGATRDLQTWTRAQGTSADDCSGLSATLQSLNALPSKPDANDSAREPFPRTKWTTKHGWETERYGELVRTTSEDVHAHMSGLTRSRFITGVLPYVYHRRRMTAMPLVERQSVVPIMFEDDGRGGTTRQTLQRLDDQRKRCFRRSLDLLSDRTDLLVSGPVLSIQSRTQQPAATRSVNFTAGTQDHGSSAPLPRQSPRMPRTLQRLAGMIGPAKAAPRSALARSEGRKNLDSCHDHPQADSAADAMTMIVEDGLDPASRNHDAPQGVQRDNDGHGGESGSEHARGSGGVSEIENRVADSVRLSPSHADAPSPDSKPLAHQTSLCHWNRGSSTEPSVHETDLCRASGEVGIIIPDSDLDLDGDETQWVVLNDAIAGRLCSPTPAQLGPRAVAADHHDDEGSEVGSKDASSEPVLAREQDQETARESALADSPRGRTTGWCSDSDSEAVVVNEALAGRLFSLTPTRHGATQPEHWQPCDVARPAETQSGEGLSMEGLTEASLSASEGCEARSESGTPGRESGLEGDDEATGSRPARHHHHVRDRHISDVNEAQEESLPHHRGHDPDQPQPSALPLHAAAMSPRTPRKRTPGSDMNTRIAGGESGRPSSGDSRPSTSASKISTSTIGRPEDGSYCSAYRRQRFKLGAVCECGRPKKDEEHRRERHCVECTRVFTPLANDRTACWKHTGTPTFISHEANGSQLFAWSCCPKAHAFAASLTDFMQKQIPHGRHA